MSTSCRGDVLLDMTSPPMHAVVADAVQQSQVEKLPVVMLAVGMMDFDLVLHREVQSAMRAASALVLEELPSG